MNFTKIHHKIETPKMKENVGSVLKEIQKRVEYDVNLTGSVRFAPHFTTSFFHSFG